MASSFGEVLDRMTRVPGIVAAILMKVDGSITAQSVSEKLDVSRVRGLARDLFARWDGIGADLGIGRPRMVVSTTLRGPLSLIPVAPDAVLLAMGNRGCSVGRIRHELRRAGEAMREAHGVSHETAPALGTTVAAMVSHGAAGSARPTERAPGEWRGPGPAAEIVVSGVDTFRLALKLVTALGRAKGVRSAILKTYEPGSITIEVASEDRGTLASIDGRSFGDCPLDLIERTEARVVLAIPVPVAPAAAVAGRVPSRTAGALALRPPGE